MYSCISSGLRALLIQKSIKLHTSSNQDRRCLRALLIQKSIKLSLLTPGKFHGLRALLIQKSIKLHSLSYTAHKCLRALLIQKSIKPGGIAMCSGGGFESFVNSEEYQTIIVLNNAV